MELNELLEQVDRLKAEIDALRPIDAAQERRIMQKFRLDWTFHSNKLEGNTLTYGETRAYFLHEITAQGRPIRDYLDIQGHIDAIDQLLVLIGQEQRLTEAALRELHKILLVRPYETDALTPDGRPTKKKVQLGQYKKTPNHVRTSTGENHYYATPEETTVKMADLMAWYRQELDKREMHPLILAAMFHFRFVEIHPFDDGNGRMARLLMNLIFMQAGFPPVIVCTEDKNNYLLALEQADTGDLEPFIVHIGNELLNSLNLFLRGAKGEDIDEAEDFDKKLALLEKRLEGLEVTRKEKIITQEREREMLLSDFLSPFFSQLSNQLGKFNRFFESSSFVFSKGGSDVQFSPEDTSMLNEYLPKLMGKLTPLQVRYLWNKFKSNPKFNLWLIVDIVLEDTRFRLVYADSKGYSFDIIKDVYGQEYSSTQIKKLATNVANEVIKIIERQV